MKTTCLLAIALALTASGCQNIRSAMGGDFTVSGDSGGSISHSGVAGRVSIPGDN